MGTLLTLIVLAAVASYFFIPAAKAPIDRVIGGLRDWAVALYNRFRAPKQ